jgi:hypothetical protein
MKRIPIIVCFDGKELFTALTTLADIQTSLDIYETPEGQMSMRETRQHFDAMLHQRLMLMSMVKQTDAEALKKEGVAILEESGMQVTSSIVSWRIGLPLLKSVGGKLPFTFDAVEGIRFNVQRALGDDGRPVTEILGIEKLVQERFGLTDGQHRTR